MKWSLKVNWQCKTDLVKIRAEAQASLAPPGVKVQHQKGPCLKAQTHQANIKKRAAVKANCGVASHHLCWGQKVALEHTTKSIANSQLAHTYCACMRENNSSYQQVAAVCTCHLKSETRRLRNADAQTVNKATFAYHFQTIHNIVTPNWEYVWNWQLLVFWLWKKGGGGGEK